VRRGIALEFGFGLVLLVSKFARPELDSELDLGPIVEVNSSVAAAVVVVAVEKTARLACFLCGGIQYLREGSAA